MSTVMDAEAQRGIRGAVGEAIVHDSGHLHVSGEAIYTDDITEPRGILHMAVGMSSMPHAHIAGIDLTAVLAAPGVVDTARAVGRAAGLGPGGRRDGVGRL